MVSVSSLIVFHFTRTAWLSEMLNGTML